MYIKKEVRNKSNIYIYIYIKKKGRNKIFTYTQIYKCRDHLLKFKPKQYTSKFKMPPYFQPHM